jgi:dTDP-4-dehydrorhamnose 3,5-epimerase
MPFSFEHLRIPEVIKISPVTFPDERGFFMELYKHSEFSKAGIRSPFVQDNCSKSRKGVLRGMHYQLNPMAQGKLVRCPVGKIFDVAVDIRKGSPTYGQWVGVELTEDENVLLFIPPGFAHGFVALTDGAEVVYKCTAEYSSQHDRGVVWNDPFLKIRWPCENPIVSSKDQKHPFLKDADNDFSYVFHSGD